MTTQFEFEDIFNGDVWDDIDLNTQRETVAPKPTVAVSILGKRTFSDSFEKDTFEDERYGQHISNDFFVANIGHLAKNNSKYEPIKRFSELNILEWIEYYKKNRHLFNV
jgi:hypothetical protein